MISQTIIKAAAKDGVRLAIAADGALRVAGERSAVERWRPIIREKKAEVLAVLRLHEAADGEDNRGNPEASHCWWRIYYAGRAPIEVAYCPPANRAEVKAGEPGAVAAEPFEPVGRRAKTPLSGCQEGLIRRWLAKIGETDVDTIEDLLDRCHTDVDAREYFLKFAEQMK